MRTAVRSAYGLVAAVALVACSSPATSPPPPGATTAPTAATPPSSPVMDPKGTIDAAKTVAGAASAATASRQAAVAVQPGASPQPGQVASAEAVAASAAAVLIPTAPKYDAGGRRDPFESLEVRAGSDRSTVAAARLTGVIQNGASALALVETSDGIGYILKPGDTLADGRLVEIHANTVVFAIAPKPGSATNKVVLRLPTD